MSSISALLNCSVIRQVSPRPNAWVRGKRLNTLPWVAVYSRSGLGATYGADRWKTVIFAASGWMPGTNWMALAPVPSTATRLPRRSTEWSHSAEWKAGPWKVPSPGSSGIEGRDSWPTAVTSTSVSICSPVEVCRCQLAVAVVVRRRGDLDAGADQVEDAVLAGGPLDVAEDLVLPGVAVRPRGVGRERPRVEGGRHVARRVGVGVLAPDAADAVGLLEHGDVAVSRALQLDGGAQAAEAGTDDGDRGLAHGRNLSAAPACAGAASQTRGSVMVARSWRPCSANLCSTSTS